MIATKPLHIKFDKIDRFIKFYYGNRYLVLLRLKKYRTIYNRIRHLNQKSSITYVLPHYYPKIKVDIYNNIIIIMIIYIYIYIYYIYIYNAEKRELLVIMLRFGETKVAKEK